VKCDKTTEDPKKHIEPFKLLRVEAGGLRVARFVSSAKTRAAVEIIVRTAFGNILS
jgi:hypothetical protein